MEKPEVFAANKTIIEKICKENNIEWIPLVYHKSPPVLSTLYDIKLMRAEVEKLIGSKEISLIHCRSYISALIGLQMKRKRNIPFIFDMRGFYADERVDGGIWKLNNFIYRNVYRFFKKKEKQYFTESAYNISLTFSAEKEISTWNFYDKTLSKIKVIPCCADLKHFSITNTSKENSLILKTKLGISDTQFVLVYLGAVGTWYLTDQMMQFYLKLKVEKPDSVFLILTAEEPRLVYETAMKNKVDVDSLRVVKASRKEVPEYLLFCHASVFFIKPVFSKKASSPTKLGELLSMGIPIVCNSGVGDVETIVKSSNTGVVINEFSDYELENAAKQILEFPKGEELRQRAEKVINFFSLEEGIERYGQVYKEILFNKIKDDGTFLP